MLNAEDLKKFDDNFQDPAWDTAFLDINQQSMFLVLAFCQLQS